MLPGTDTLLAWSLAAELEKLGAFDDAFIAKHVLGAEEFMERARQWPAARGLSSSSSMLTKQARRESGSARERRASGA